MKPSPRSLKLLEIFGWYGAIAILSAYALVSFNVVPADGWAYQLLNLTGAIGVMIISFIKQARQPALLNLVWALVAFIALIGLAIK